MTDQHHLYSASGSAGWMTCPGKVTMEDGIVESYSSFADEGSAAHFLGSVCLPANINPKDYIGIKIICWEREGGRDGQCFNDELIPEGAKGRSQWPVTEDMAEHIQTYVTAVRKLAKGNTLLVEQRVEFGDAIGLPGAFGTGDAIVLTADDTTLIVADLKYGHTEVSAIDNTQLMLYALGALHEFDMLIDANKLTTIKLVILQPRIHNESVWEIGINKLIEFAGAARDAIALAEEAQEALQDYTDANDIAGWAKEYLHPSEKGCRWCKAKGNCPALAQESMNELALIEAPTADGLFDLDAQAEALPATIDERLKLLPSVSSETVAKLYAAIEKIDLWKAAIQARMMYDMLNGQKHDDWKLVKGKLGNRKWKDEEEAEKLLKSLRYKKEDMYSMKLISPTTAEKLLKEKPKAWEKAQALIVRGDNTIVIAPRHDKRPPLDPYNDQIALLPDLTLDDLC